MCGAWEIATPINHQFSYVACVFTQYENMKDESEGVKIEDIEKIYNDKEDESKYPLATSTV